MSDTSQGEGWWQASDEKWYPPEQHPNAVAAKKKVWPWIVGGVILLFIVLVIVTPKPKSKNTANKSATTTSKVHAPTTTTTPAPTTTTTPAPTTTTAAPVGQPNYVALTMNVSVLDQGWLVNYNIGNAGSASGTPRCTSTVTMPGEPDVGPYPEPSANVDPGQTVSKIGAIPIPAQDAAWASLVTPQDVLTSCQ